MPIYHYLCKSCNHDFEISHGIKQKPLRKCPACGRLKLERVLYACYGRVARSADQMGNVGDLAKFNTDKLTKGEKESKDHEYAEGSKLAKYKLKKQTLDRPWYHSSNDQKDISQKLARATPKQKQKYTKDGTI